MTPEERIAGIMARCAQIQELQTEIIELIGPTFEVCVHCSRVEGPGLRLCYGTERTGLLTSPVSELTHEEDERGRWYRRDWAKDIKQRDVPVLSW